MYVYIQSEHTAYGSLWTVGFYDPKGKWQPESDHDTAEKAAERVAYLNGQNECRSCGLARSVSEALNSGNGTYKP